jgi:hypothetical protein
MRIFNINEEYLVFKGEKIAEPKFRVELSRMVVENFGKPNYEAATVTVILYYCRDYYISKFEQILASETSYTFYKQVVWLHEQSCQLRESTHFDNLPAGLDKSYISLYRRVLKLILEQGCLVKMVTGEKITPAFRKRIEPIMDDLLFLGEMMQTISESIAEQEMVEDAIDVDFDEKGNYVFTRRHHYEVIYTHIKEKMEQEDPSFIVDATGFGDYQNAIKECFRIDYNKYWQAILLMMQHFKIPDNDCVSLDCEGFKRDLQNYIECDAQLLDKFIAGLTISADNKLTVLEALKKPHSLNRYLYRPFLKWNIKGKDCFVFSVSSCMEAEASLYLNAIPWQKIPIEWQQVAGVNTYASRKHDEHDKWLEDVIENTVKQLSLVYHRNLEKLITNQNSYSLLQKDLGEIDFVIISETSKKVYVADCKHLLGRYDMVNQRNDYGPFLQDDEKKISYTTRMNNKVNWLKENRDNLEEHFRIKYNRTDLSIDDYEIEGVFFINTPTFLMYNSEIRIYTHDQVEGVLDGSHVDPKFTYMVDTDESNIMYSVKYPYFRKPKMIYYDNPDDDCEVDKYGFPIRQ